MLIKQSAKICASKNSSQHAVVFFSQSGQKVDKKAPFRAVQGK